MWCWETVEDFSTSAIFSALMEKIFRNAKMTKYIYSQPDESDK